MSLAPLSRSAEVIIARLALDTPQTVRAIALASLDRTSWPSAGPAGTPWLILRQLQVESEGWDLGPRAGAAAQVVARDAVNGWSARAVDALAVSFENLADLVACLSRDIALGQAERFWFWQNWQIADTLPSMPRLWSDHAAELPQIARILDIQGALASSMAALSVEDVLAVVQRVSLVTRWALPPILPLDALVIETAETSAETSEQAVAGVPGRFAAALPPDPRTAAAAAQFLAILQIWEDSPELLLTLGSATSAVRSRGRYLLEIRNMAPAAPAVEPDQIQLPEMPKSQPGETHAGAPGNSEEMSVSPVVTADPPPVLILETGQVSDGAENSSVSEIEMRAEAVPGEPTDSAPVLAEGFITGQGGLFYLINALNQPDISERIFASSKDSGWRWLWHVARGLGLEPDAALVQFFSARLDCDVPADLFELPPTTGFAAIKRLLDGRYRRSGVWDGGLLPCPAVIRLTASHLDIHIPLEHARVDVRQSGLDRDPGWVDWLGRIVAFHFGAVPELAGRPVDE